jgi:hypothetical protein
MGNGLAQTLEPLAEMFRSLNLPEPITHWGHPFFMSIVMFLMGGYAAYSGWQGRLLRETDAEAAAKFRANHSKTIAATTLFMAIGATGGILSLVMQKHAILESPHFVTGMGVLALLFINGAVAATGFGGENPTLRKGHAYFGSGILVLMVVHAIAGFKLGLSF